MRKHLVRHVFPTGETLSINLIDLVGKLPSPCFLSRCLIEVTAPALCNGYWIEYMPYQLIKRISFGEDWKEQGILICPKPSISGGNLWVVNEMNFKHRDLKHPHGARRYLLCSF